MKTIGGPVSIQNTDAGHWLVTCDPALTSTDGEHMAFTVAVPRQPNLTVGNLQLAAVRQALARLQSIEKALSSSSK